MNIEKIKNTLREYQAGKFKNTQAEFKKAVSYIKKSVFHEALPLPCILGLDT